MATVVGHTGHTLWEDSSQSARGRRRGQGDLAEVSMIRPGSRSAGSVGSLVNAARVFASPRPQAASVPSAPQAPSSPAPLSALRVRPPHDAA